MTKMDPAEAVRQAKAAVEDLDEPYKMEAFKVVLDKLMSRGNALPATLMPRTKAPRTGSSTRRKSGRASSGDKASAVSKLDLKVPELEKLQKFVSRFTVKGSEICCFVIANFLRLELKVTRFSTADIEYCYRQLISLKVSVPEIRDVNLSLLWLISPSRKKEWLRKVGEEFELTNSGLIAFNNLETTAKAKQNE